MHRAIPSLLLATIAIVQIVLTRTVDLTPWKGGGFGMFSTLDHGAFRGLDIVVDGPDRSETLAVPPSLEERVARAVACPSTSMLELLAQGVADRERRHGRTVSAVKIAVWGTHVDAVTLNASERSIRSLTWVVD